MRQQIESSRAHQVSIAVAKLTIYTGRSLNVTWTSRGTLRAGFHGDRGQLENRAVRAPSAPGCQRAQVRDRSTASTVPLRMSE